MPYGSVCIGFRTEYNHQGLVAPVPHTLGLLRSQDLKLRLNLVFFLDHIFS